MSDPQDRQAQPGRAYSGKTVVMPRTEREGREGAQQPYLQEQYAPPHDASATQPLPDSRRARRPNAKGNLRRNARYKTRNPAWARIRLALFAGLVLLLLGFGIFYWQIHSVARNIVVRDVRSNPSIATPLIGGANVLLIGVDERPDHPEEGVRSDTLILAHLDAAGRWVSLLSIPRDTQVELPDVGVTKINIAYAQGYARAAELYRPETTPQQGGMALAAQTVENFLGLRERGLGSVRVDYIAQINFDGFAGIIDALDGITIDVPKQIIDEEFPTADFGVMRVEFQPGPQRMDGQTALIYARTRHADSDFGRAERQQQVLRAMVSEMRAKGWLGRITALPAVLRSVQGADGNAPPVITTMPIDRLDVVLSMMALAGSISPDTIAQTQISPEHVAVTEIGSNLVWDQAGVRSVVDQFLTRPSEVAERAVVQVFNGTGIGGLAGEISGELDQAGFTILVADNAPPGDYPSTIVYDRNNNPRTSKRVADLLNAAIQAGPPPEGLVSEADIVVILGNDQAEQ